MWLARIQGASSVGDGLITAALAGSIFFNISPDAARARVAAALIVTVAPFAVITPLLGPAIDRAKGDIRSEMGTQYGQQIDQLNQGADVARARLASLEAQVNVLRDEKNKLATRLTAMEAGSDGLPILAIVTIAVLAGAAAGFMMSWLGGRPGATPTVGLSPAPRGADPA